MSAEKPSVMVVDDEVNFLRALERVLVGAGCEVHAFSDPRQAVAFLPEAELDVVITDVRMPELSGLDVLRTVKARKPDAEVIMLTAHATVEIAVEALKAGAYDFLRKPLDDIDDVVRLVRRAVDRQKLVVRNNRLEQIIEARDKFEGLVGQNFAMREVYKLVEAIAYSSSTVLIQGESGTGKELVARAVHDRSPRRMKPFVAVNCGALPETILESELFGHVKGAFTGAVTNKKGLFEAAQGGTIFLDEIGEIPLTTQVKLLRTIQEGEVKPVGSAQAFKVDVRILAATNVELAAAIKRGTFREDLYYRINVIGIRLPPLRDRPDDIPILAYHFLRKHGLKAGKEIKRISPPVLETLSTATWSGNVRELENVIERAVVLCTRDSIELEDLPEELRDRAGAPTGSDLRFEEENETNGSDGGLARMPYARAKVVAMRSFERRYIDELLTQNEGNISSAARAAGMDRSNFRRILKKHRIQVADDVQDA